MVKFVRMRKKTDRPSGRLPVRVRFGGRLRTLAELVLLSAAGVTQKVLRDRLRLGWSAAKAVGTPLGEPPTSGRAAASPGRLPLPRGKFALVSTRDYERFVGGRWYVGTNGYVVRNTRSSTGTVALAREVLGVTDPCVLVDHWNGNLLDCRRSNLRKATRGQNRANWHRLRRDNKTGVQGARVNRSGRWYAEIRVAGKTRWLGTFDSRAAAVRAYDDAAKQAWGRFSRHQRRRS